MGKDGNQKGFLTPKQISNRIKAKGLQKLRWYCQMCQKQCRDENGFKCHCNSESHQRQMAVFGMSPDTFMNDFSHEFEDGMMEIISRKARTRMAATVVYNEYIADKHHVHMNGTIWETLTDFVIYLGRTGKAVVEETKKGWFITYVPRDAETIRRQEEQAKREKYELDSEERHLRDIERQVKKARREGIDEGTEATELQRTDEDEKVTFGVTTKVTSKLVDSEGKKKPPVPSFFGGDDEAEASESGAGSSNGGAGSSSSSSTTTTTTTTSSSSSRDKPSSKMSSMEKLMKEETARKEKDSRRDYWLAMDITVKCVNKKLSDGKYYKQKGTVVKLVDKYTAHVRMKESGDTIKLDQDMLETVIPQIGGRVLVVNGAYRGEQATLQSIDTDKFCATIRISGGRHGGITVEKVEYEDICKLA